MCSLCNCDICAKKFSTNKSDNIYNILESFLNDSIDEDSLNISFEQSIYNTNDEVKLDKDTNSNNEDISKVKAISCTTVGTYVQTNITDVKVNPEYSNNTKSEDTVTQKESNLITIYNTSSISSKSSYVQDEYSIILNNTPTNKNGSVQLLGQGSGFEPLTSMTYIHQKYKKNVHNRDEDKSLVPKGPASNLFVRNKTIIK